MDTRILNNEASDSVDLTMVSMPWASNTRPSLAVGLLLSLASKTGVSCNAYYPSFEIAKEIGYKKYETFAQQRPLFGISEHLFACQFFSHEELDSDYFLNSCVVNNKKILFNLRDNIIPSFLSEIADQVLAGNSKLVGFSCTFNQVFASLALSRILKKENPDIDILFGGACMHGEMGVAYANYFQKYIDFVFTGESDLCFPEFLKKRLANESIAIPGIVGSGCAESLPESALPMVDESDTTHPDYDMWFSMLQQHPELLGQNIFIPFESSRGCWWGEKSHCTFCGLNSEGMKYRTKSVTKTISEIEQLSAKYGRLTFMAADNILDKRSFDHLLPALTEMPVDVHLFYEIKANTSREKMSAMADAGIKWVQPGIESFSDHILKLMGKGIGVLNNLLLLRLCEEFDVAPVYNILVGFPGESDLDYEESRTIVEKIMHLPPPSSPMTTKVEVHRFSPFFSSPEKYGIANIRAADYYSNLLPGDVGGLNQFAYFFDHEVTKSVISNQMNESLNEALATWTSNKSKCSKRCLLGAGELYITSVSDGVTKTLRLNRFSSAIVILADEVATVNSIKRSIKKSTIKENSEDAVETRIGRLVNRGILVRKNNSVVSVVPFSGKHSKKMLNTWLEKWFSIKSRIGKKNKDVAVVKNMSFVEAKSLTSE